MCQFDNQIIFIQLKNKLTINNSNFNINPTEINKKKTQVLCTRISKSNINFFKKDDFVKIDIYYTEKYVFNELIIDNVRMAASDEIIAMKLDVINNKGRKKDFWDIHYFLENYELAQFIELFEKRYPYGISKTLKNQLLEIVNSIEL